MWQESETMTNSKGLWVGGKEKIECQAESTNQLFVCYRLLWTTEEKRSCHSTSRLPPSVSSSRSIMSLSSSSQPFVVSVSLHADHYRTKIFLAERHNLLLLSFLFITKLSLSITGGHKRVADYDDISFTFLFFISRPCFLTPPQSGWLLVKIEKLLLAAVCFYY